MGRTIAIWVFGLLAAGIIGGFLGSIYDAKIYQYGNGIGTWWGVIGGWCVFACLRLWLTPKEN